MTVDKSLYVPSKWGALFHALDHDEVLAAGAAGPGKSMVLLMDPFHWQITTEHERCMDPDHEFHLPWGGSSGWALHLRRTRPMLELSIQRSHRIFPLIDPGAGWNENKATWTFRSGYKFQFGHCHDSADWQNYLSFEFTHIAYDELIQFEEEQYDQINTRLRSSDPVLRTMLKIRACSNPLMSKQKGDNFSIKDPNWVRKRFVDPAPEGRVTLKKQLRMQDGRVVEHKAIYLPATLFDNPDEDFKRDYEAKLQNAKPHIRQALLFGNWYITAGSFYADVWNQNLHVCKPFKVPKEWAKWRSMDWGFKLPGCVHWWAMDEDGNIYCTREMMFQGISATELAKQIIAIEEGMGLVKKGKSILTGPADTQLWEDRGDGTKGKAQDMADEGVNWVKAKKGAGSRLRNAELLYDRLADHSHGTTAPGIVFFETCREVIKLLPAIGTSDKNSEEPADGNDDHPIDSCIVAGTLVETPHGAVAIEKLNAGDQVLSTDGSYWTCFGGRLTRKSTRVMRVVFSNGVALTATPDHRLLCSDGVWRRIDEIDSSCYAFSPWIRSSSQEQSRSSQASATTSAVSTSNATVSGYTESSGRLEMEKFPKGFMSTMWTKTVRTIRSRILSFFQGKNTTGSTLAQWTSTQLEPAWTTPGSQPLLGIVQKQDWRGTVSTLANLSPGPENQLQAIASVAGSRSSGEASSRPDGVRKPVARRSDGPRAPTWWRDYALPAGSRSWQTGTNVKPPVHGVALGITAIEEAGMADVYCTQVPIMGAFVANGVVVSNCWYSCGYASHGRAGLGWKSSDSDDMDDEDEKPKAARGRWGYGSRVM